MTPRDAISGEEYSDPGHLATVLLLASALFKRVADRAATNPTKARRIAEAATVELCRQVEQYDKGKRPVMNATGQAAGRERKAM